MQIQQSAATSEQNAEQQRE